MEAAEIDCKAILEYIGNCSTKVVEKDDIRANYYSFLNDTIYISTIKIKDGGKINNKIKKLLVMCHEAIHSTQSKKLQMINFVLANVELIYFIYLFIASVKSGINIHLILSYVFISLASMITRGYLEVNAVRGSIKLSSDLLNKGIVKKGGLEDFHKIVIKINKVLPFEILRINIFKIIRIVILFVI